MSALAVVVVNYDGGEDVLECLSSIVKQWPAQVVVVDNASSDGSPDRIASAHPGVDLVRNAANTGFAAAANQGVRRTRAPFVLLLNADAVLAPGALDALERCLEGRPRCGAVGALVRNPDGSVQPTKRAFPKLWQAALHATVGLVWPNNPGSRAYVLADADLSRARTVDWVAGPAMALRRTAFDEAKGFDEAFFFFVEDVDLCRRLWDAGWEVWFEPSAEVIHVWGGSWTRRPLRFLWIHHVNLFRYVRKHRRGAWVLVYPFVAVGLAVRFTLLAIRWLITRRTVPAHRGGST